jgi:hypothetical protein
LFNKTKVEDIEGYNDFSFLDELYSTPEEDTLIQEGEVNPVLNIGVSKDKAEDIITKLSNEEVDLSNLESINDTYLELLTRPTE